MDQIKKIKEISVEEFTTPSPVTMSADASIIDVKNKMKELGVRHMPILRGDKIIGILSDRDVKLIESCFEDPSSVQADYVMTVDPYVVSASTPLHEVVFYMSKEKIGSAIVESDDGFGIFTSTDALNALLEVLRGEV